MISDQTGYTTVSDRNIVSDHIHDHHRSIKNCNSSLNMLSIVVVTLATIVFLVSGCSNDMTTTPDTTTTSDTTTTTTTTTTPNTTTTTTMTTTPDTTTTPNTTTTTTSDELTASQDGYHVMYTTEDGFTPKRIDVPIGEDVIFVNNSDGFMWPASNIHPTHEILPSFDPQQAIKPGETWAYRFEENGYWRYHNHIEPSQGGLIVSSGDSTEERELLDMSMPNLEFPDPPASAAQDYDLYNSDSDLADFLKTYGPSATAGVLKEIELSTPGIDCHNRAHEVGRMAFEELGPIAFALASHECQSGVFHGSTEALFAARGTANLTADVTAVCSLAENAFIRHQCLHGVGHGLMAWTTYEIHETLDLCDNLTDPSDRMSCYSGVFMENVVGGLTGAMGHKTEYLREDDAHFPCDVVEEQYMPDCYFYQTSHMLKVFDYDYSQVAQACLEAPSTARRHCFASYGRDVGAATRGDPALAIVYCSFATADNYRVECIQGAVQDRFWEKPGADEAASMCGMLKDDDASRDACYNTIITRAGYVFSDDTERSAFCAKLPESRQQNCRSIIATNS